MRCAASLISERSRRTLHRSVRRARARVHDERTRRRREQLEPLPSDPHARGPAALPTTTTVDRNRLQDQEQREGQSSAGRGAGTQLWHQVHRRPDARLGRFVGRTPRDRPRLETKGARLQIRVKRRFLSKLNLIWNAPPADPDPPPRDSGRQASRPLHRDRNRQSTASTPTDPTRSSPPRWSLGRPVYDATQFETSGRDWGGSSCSLSRSSSRTGGEFLQQRRR